MGYTPTKSRYDTMKYNRCGQSGIMLPALSLGLWHNFGGVDAAENGRAIIHAAFDAGITHFDLANNYGPPPGSAEDFFGRMLATDLAGYRDELIISSKAGYYMWPGPYGNWGSRKYLVASIDQSLRRMGLEYVDVFYSHRPDPDTPIEETMGALDHIVRSGKALYAGISNYNAEQTSSATAILKKLGTPCLIHQPRYSMLNRWVEDKLLNVLEQNGIGCIAFSPLAQGLLTSKYMQGIPEDSRAAKEHGFLKREQITGELLTLIRTLNDIASRRDQSLAQMAIAWLLRDNRITSVLIGASRVTQLRENIASLDNISFSDDELMEIDRILVNQS